MAKSFRRARALLLAGARAPSITGTAFMMIGSLHAYAMQSCSGMYSATLLQPLTEPTVITLDLADSSVVPASLGQAFTSGMQAAGATVSGTPTVRLRLSYQVTGQGGGRGGGGGLNTGGGPQTGWSNWSGCDAAALQGGQTLALPDIPNYDVFSPAASLQCTMQGTDNTSLAT